MAHFLVSAPVLLCLLTLASSDRVVMTNEGPVQGVTLSSSGDRSLEVFLGIPFAEPPVGRLRFSRPVPKTPWMGVYDASRPVPTCIQNVTGDRYYYPDVTNMTEDCLYLSLWVPYQDGQTKLKPVIVYFHGGAFNHASSNMKIFDGARLAEFGDVVVVTMNYRVGAMGFFTGFIHEANGNMGIFDLLLATQWVKNNIKSFGGDPEHLVLMGESAGAMIIGGFLTSSQTRGLFRRAIMQSGSSTGTLILEGNNARLLQRSQKLAAISGCADKSVTLADHPRLVVDCLKRLPARDLAKAEGLMLLENPVSFFPRSGDEFLPEASIDLYKKGHFHDVELLTGVNEEEGTMFLTVSNPLYFGVYGQNNVKTLSRRLTKQLLTFMYKSTDQTNGKAIAEYYTALVTNDTSDAFTKAMSLSAGDYMIVCNTYYTAELMSMRNPVYFYVFARRPSSTPLASWMGVTHFDELQYVFGNPIFQNFTREEEVLSRRIMSRWMSFAKTGNPNIPGEVEWPVFTRDHPRYLRIDDQDSAQIRPDNERCEFWRDRHKAEIDDQVIAGLLSSSGTQAITSFLCVFMAFIVAKL